jgi:hypothetical protein
MDDILLELQNAQTSLGVEPAVTLCQPANNVQCRFHWELNLVRSLPVISHTALIRDI